MNKCRKILEFRGPENRKRFKGNPIRVEMLQVAHLNCKLCLPYSAHVCSRKNNEAQIF